MLYRDRWTACEAEPLKLYIHIFINGVLTDATSIGSVAIYPLGIATPQVTFSTPTRVSLGTYMIIWNIPSTDLTSPLYNPSFTGLGPYSDVWSNIVIGSNTYTRTFNFVINPATFATNTSLAIPYIFNFVISNPILQYGAKDYLRIVATEANNSLTPDIDIWPDGEIRIRRNQSVLQNYIIMTHPPTSNIYNYYIDTTTYTIGVYEAQMKFELPAYFSYTSAILSGTQNLSAGYSPVTGSLQNLILKIDGAQQTVSFPGTATAASITASGHVWTDPIFITEDDPNNTLYVSVDGGNYQVINLTDGVNRTVADIANEINGLFPYNTAFIRSKLILTGGVPTIVGKHLKIAFDNNVQIDVNFTTGTALADIITDINTHIAAQGVASPISGYLQIASSTPGAISKVIIGNGDANVLLGFTDYSSAMGADRLEGGHAETSGTQLVIMSDTAGAASSIEIGNVANGSTALTILGLAAGINYGTDSEPGQIDGAKAGGLSSATFVAWEQAEIVSGAWAIGGEIVGAGSTFNVSYTNVWMDGTLTTVLVTPPGGLITVQDMVTLINTTVGIAIADYDTSNRLILQSPVYGNDARVRIVDVGGPACASMQFGAVVFIEDYGYSGNNWLWLQNQNSGGIDQTIILNVGTFTPTQVVADIQSKTVGINASSYIDESSNTQIRLSSSSYGSTSIVQGMRKYYPVIGPTTLWCAAETIGYDAGAFLLGNPVTGSIAPPSANRHLRVIIDEGASSEVIKNIELQAGYANLAALATDINIASSVSTLSVLNPEANASVTASGKLQIQSTPSSPYWLCPTTIVVVDFSGGSGPANCNINIDGRGNAAISLVADYTAGGALAVVAGINTQIQASILYGANSVYTTCASLDTGRLKITSSRKGSNASVVLNTTNGDWDTAFGTLANRVLEPYATAIGTVDIAAGYTFAGTETFIIDIGSFAAPTSYTHTFGAGVKTAATIASDIDTTIGLWAKKANASLETVGAKKYLKITTDTTTGLDTNARIKIYAAGTANSIMYKPLVENEINIHPSNLAWGIGSKIKFSEAGTTPSTCANYIGYGDVDEKIVGYDIGVDATSALTTGVGASYPVDIFSYTNNQLKIDFNAGGFNPVQFQPSTNYTLQNIIDFINGQAQVIGIGAVYSIVLTTANNILEVRIDSDTLDRTLTLPVGTYYLTSAGGANYLVGPGGAAIPSHPTNWEHNGQPINFDVDDFEGQFRIFSKAINSVSSRVEIRNESVIADGTIDISGGITVPGGGLIFRIDVGNSATPSVHTVTFAAGVYTSANILSTLNLVINAGPVVHKAVATLNGNYLRITGVDTGINARIVIYRDATSTINTMIYKTLGVNDEEIFGSLVNTILGMVSTGDISDVGAISTTFYPQPTTLDYQSFFAYMSARITAFGQLKFWTSKVSNTGASSNYRMVTSAPLSTTDSKSLEIGNDQPLPTGEESFINTYIGFDSIGMGPIYGNFGIVYPLSGVGGIIDAINSAYGNDQIATNAGGYLRLGSLTQGLNSTIEIISGTSSEILSNFGFVVTSVTGTEMPHVAQTILSPWLQFTCSG